MRPDVDVAVSVARGQILRGAADVFARKGFADATVEDILRAGRVSRRTFYRFFRDKLDALAALHEVAVELFHQGFRAALAGVGAPETRLERAIDAYLAFATHSGPLMKVMYGEAHRPGSRLAPGRRRSLDGLVALFAEPARLLAGAEVDPLLLRGLFLALEGVVHELLAAGTPPDPARVAQARAAMLRLATATLAGRGRGVAPMPTPPAMRSP